MTLTDDMMQEHQPAYNDPLFNAAHSLMLLKSEATAVEQRCVEFLKEAVRFEIDDMTDVVNVLSKRLQEMLISFASDARKRHTTPGRQTLDGNSLSANVPELMFVFHVLAELKTNKESMLFFASKQTPEYRPLECVSARRSTLNKLAIHHMIFIMQRYGPEFSRYDCTFIAPSKDALIRRKFHQWNPSFFFSFFYCETEDEWKPYLGMKKEMERRELMRERWKFALEVSRLDSESAGGFASCKYQELSHLIL